MSKRATHTGLVALGIVGLALATGAASAEPPENQYVIPEECSEIDAKFVAEPWPGPFYADWGPNYVLHVYVPFGTFEDGYYDAYAVVCRGVRDVVGLISDATGNVVQAR